MAAISFAEVWVLFQATNLGGKVSRIAGLKGEGVIAVANQFQAAPLKGANDGKLRRHRLERRQRKRFGPRRSEQQRIVRGIYPSHVFYADRSELDTVAECLRFFLQSLGVSGIAASIDRKSEVVGKEFHRSDRGKGILILSETSDIEESL